MTRRCIIAASTFALLASCLTECALAQAPARGKAVVVGVNEYSMLSDDLYGCVPDATMMAAKLHQYGFEVALLTDEQATRAGVVGAIAALAQAAQPTDMIAFYFAGHGSNNATSGATILLSDALPNDDQHDLTRDELNALVAAVPGASHTIMLDSCFSGAMTRAFERGGRGVRSRYYQRGATASGGARGGKDVVRVNAHDVPVEPSNGSVCYFVASMQNEPAAEMDFPDGSTHGVFTYYLDQVLDGSSLRWGTVQQMVSSRVAEKMISDEMNEVQHPSVTPQFTGAVVFANNGEQVDPQPGPALDLWDTYNADHVNPSAIVLSLSPDRTPLAIGEAMHLEINVGHDGYLAVVELGTSGRYNLLFPEDGQSPRVSAGQKMVLPEPGWWYEATEAGFERMRAILFTSEQGAAELIGVFRGGQSYEAQEFVRATRDVVKVHAEPAEFYTSDILFEVR